MDNTDAAGKDRKKYWDEKYRDYWMQRVADTNSAKGDVSAINQQDKPTSSDLIYLEAIELLHITQGTTVLEMGCGFGRSIPFLRPTAGELHLIDISDAMIKTARENHPSDGQVHFHVCEAEKTPFKSDMFDYVVCFAVLDALYQSKALAEMNRIGKIGSRVLLTGKNYDYCDDDEAAYAAEIGARSKGHPNYFTNVADLEKNISRFGFKIKSARYYKRRGDFAENKYEPKMPDQFYEYMFVLEKVAPIASAELPSISDAFSATWRRKNSKS